MVLSHELLNQSANIEATITNGAVSGFKQDALGQDIIQTDAAAAHGNSGGPTIGVRRQVLGVMTFVTLSAAGSIVQGFNFLIPARDVLKFLEGTEVTKPGESTFNPIWAAGIEAMFQQRYSAAVAKFAETQSHHPRPARRQAAAVGGRVLRQEPAAASLPVGVGDARGHLASVGTYGGMWGRRWWKNRYRILPAQMIGFIERGMSPIIVDARTKVDYETSPLKLPSSIRIDPDEAQAGRGNLDAIPSR